MSDILLKITDLSIAFKTEFGWADTLHSISLSVNKGEVLGVVGESGSGKSITFKSILGLIPKEICKISTQSKATLYTGNHCYELMTSDNKKIRGSKVGVVFQEPMSSLNPVMKCGKQIIEAVLLNPEISNADAKKKVLGLFEEVKIGDPIRVFESYPHQLSGGQKQRVMIAMALAQDPILIIADEPTTALDVSVQKSVIDLFKSLIKERNVGMVFISHDLGLVSLIADDVLVMKSGRVVEYGPKNEIFRNPQTPYTKGLLACRPPIDVRFESLPTVEDFNLHENYKPEEVLPKIRTARLKELSLENVILNVENLNVSYEFEHNFFGRVTKYFYAVSDVNFSLKRGEILGIVGESGSGKSTIGRAILRLVDVSSGTIQFNNKDVLQFNKQELLAYRREAQIIFQDPSGALNPDIKIGEAIMEVIGVHFKDLTNAEIVLKTQKLLLDVGLGENYFNRYPRQLSGGQKQRAVIARALALNPKLLICDESVAALDVSVQAQVLNLLNTLKQKYQLSLIFISHDLSVVRYFSDSILVLNKGKIVEYDEADQVFFNPKEVYTQQLIDAIPLIND